MGIFLYSYKRNWIEKIHKYRYILGSLLLIFCAIFEISGSSIGCWGNFIVGGNKVSSGNILGIHRSIRSDEWAVNTPMAFSQKYSGYKYFSNIIRGDKTDIFIIYGQPVKGVEIIYRFFQIGYLFFGSSVGLSIFWNARIILLFLVSYDLFMLISKNKKGLSFVGAILIVYAPIMTWWIAVNGIVEIFVSGMGSVVLLNKFMKNDNFKTRILCLLGISICAGMYLLVFYPAWQIPMFYVIIGLIVWVFLENFRTCKIHKKDVILIIIILIIFIISMANIFYKSFNTIKIILNTVYPGARFENGGHMMKKLLSYPMNIFLGLMNSDNSCEKAVFIDLFPVGIILSLVILFKYKKKDKLLIILIGVCIFLEIYCIIGFPNILAKITLLSNSPARRAVIAVGFVNILILIRSMSLIEKPFKKIISVVLSIVLTGILIYASIFFYPEYMNWIKGIIAGVFVIIIMYTCLRYNSKKCKYIFIICVSFIMCISGGIVNPIRTGIDVIYEQEIVKVIKQINDKKPGIWLVEDISYPLTNLPIMVGASTVNSTNVYPNLERWKQIDLEDEYKNIYNRYAHIVVDLIQEKTSFELINFDPPDLIKINLQVSELEKLGVDYIFTIDSLDKFNNKEINFSLLYNDYYKVYKVNYVEDMKN